MIRDKLLPSMYLVEVEGESIKALIPGDNGISKIVLASETYPTDFEAHTGLAVVMDYFKDVLGDSPEELRDFNPDFYPSLPPIKLTEEQLQEKAAIDEFIEENQEVHKAKGQLPTAITQFFDMTGDFVTFRWTVSKGEAKTVGRVVVDPTFYVREKGIEDAAGKNMFADHRENKTSRVH